MASMQFTRFSFPSATDQQAGLWITSIICPIYSVMLLGVRYTLRRNIKKSDIVLGGGYLLAVIEWAFVWAALHNGVGKSTTVISARAFTDASRFVYGSIAVALLIIAATTASQCFFVSELTSNRRQYRVCLGAAIASVILVLAALLILLVGCSSSRYLYHGGSPEAACHAQSTRWIVGGVLLGLATCVPAALPPILFHDLRVSWRQKASIYVVFGTTLLSVPLIVLVVVYFNIFNHGNQDSITAVRFYVLLQILLVWCLASATVPCSRPVALKFSTSRAQLQDTSLYGARSKNASNPRATARSVSQKGEEQSQRDANYDFVMMPSSSRATAMGPGDETASVASYGSERHFVRKTVAVTVRNDEA